MMSWRREIYTRSSLFSFMYMFYVCHHIPCHVGKMHNNCNNNIHVKRENKNAKVVLVFSFACSLQFFLSKDIFQSLTWAAWNGNRIQYFTWVYDVCAKRQHNKTSSSLEPSVIMNRSDSRRTAWYTIYGNGNCDDDAFLRVYMVVEKMRWCQYGISINSKQLGKTLISTYCVCIVCTSYFSSLFFLLLFPLLPLLLLHTLHNISVSQLCLDIIHCRYAEYSEICVNIWWWFVMPVLPPTPVCGGDGDDDSGKTHNIRLFRNIRGECVFDKMMGCYQRIFSFSPEV